MDLWTALQAVILGVVEGLTEFLPISSTGHQIVVADLLGFGGERAMAFNIIIQLGAILAVMWEYRRKILITVFNVPRQREAQRQEQERLREEQQRVYEAERRLAQEKATLRRIEAENARYPRY